MDLTTTLITFMLQTPVTTFSVRLVGSWDNFTKRYSMERDEKKGRGQWRGCYSFEDIICDGSEQGLKRSGGLKMGHTYWYYYELDNGTEIYDETLPATTSCPYLPGQPVNLLWIPVEVYPLRERRASVGGTPLAHGIKTMNPDDKFLKPRLPPPVPKAPHRLNTSPSSSWSNERAARSDSQSRPRFPPSAWFPKALFGLRSQFLYPSDRSRPSSVSRRLISRPTLINTTVDDSNHIPLPSRDISPASALQSCELATNDLSNETHRLFCSPPFLPKEGKHSTQPSPNDELTPPSVQVLKSSHSRLSMDTLSTGGLQSPSLSIPSIYDSYDDSELEGAYEPPFYTTTNTGTKDAASRSRLAPSWNEYSLPCLQDFDSEHTLGKSADDPLLPMSVPFSDRQPIVLPGEVKGGYRTSLMEEMGYLGGMIL